MTAADEKKTRQIFADIIAPVLVQQSSDSKQTNIALLNIEGHLKKLNGTVAEHNKKIEELKLADVKHIMECPAMPKIEAISTDLTEYRLFKKYPKAGIFVLFIALVLVGLNVFDVIGKVSVKKDLRQTEAIDKVQQQRIVNEYKKLILTIDSLKTGLK